MKLNYLEPTLYLGGKLKILQNPNGYKSGTDAVFLASLVCDINENTKILELGSGVGVVSLCILSRLGKMHIDSLEKQEELYNFALLNKDLNSHLNTFNPKLGNLLSYKASYLYDKVVFNPPYFKKQDKLIPNDSDKLIKYLCHTEDDAELQDFINCAFRNLKIRGEVYIIYNSKRLQELLELLTTKHWGDIEIFPIYSYENKEASRLIIKAKKLSKGASRLHYGLVVHNNDRSYTTCATNILKNGSSFFNLKS